MFEQDGWVDFTNHHLDVETCLSKTSGYGVEYLVVREVGDQNYKVYVGGHCIEDQFIALESALFSAEILIQSHQAAVPTGTKAVQAFFCAYQGVFPTFKAVINHLDHEGCPQAVPDWARQAIPTGVISPAQSADWVRYIFSQEAAPFCVTYKEVADAMNKLTQSSSFSHRMIAQELGLCKLYMAPVFSNLHPTEARIDSLVELHFPRCSDALKAAYRHLIRTILTTPKG